MFNLTDTIMPIAATLLILSAIVEGIVEYLIRPLAKPWLDDPAPDDDPGRVRWRGLILRYSASLVGLAICVIYNLDLLAALGLQTNIPFIGPVVTGLLVGRGSNWLNDFTDRWLGNP